MLKRYVADDKIAKKYGASEYPAILFFRHGIPAIYDGMYISPLPLYEHIHSFVEIDHEIFSMVILSLLLIQ